VTSLPPGPLARGCGPTRHPPGRRSGRSEAALRGGRSGSDRNGPLERGPSSAGGLVSRVLSRVPRDTRLAICLRGASPRPCSGQPGDAGEPGRLSLHIGPCTGWGLPSCPCYQGHWCALTAPFHPYGAPARGRVRGLLSVALAVALRAQSLTGTLPYGARTFLAARARRCPDGRTLPPLRGWRRRARVAARPPTLRPVILARGPEAKAFTACVPGRLGAADELVGLEPAGLGLALLGGRRARVGPALPLQRHQRPHLHVVLAHDLARQPHLAQQALLLELAAFGGGHGGGLAAHELHAAGGAARLAAAAVADLHAQVLDGQHEP